MKNYLWVGSLFLLMNSLYLHAQQRSLDWAHPLGSSSNDRGLDITLDQHGNAYTVGTFVGTIDFDFGPNQQSLTANSADAFLQKVDSNAQLVWAKSWGGNGLCWPNAVLVDDSSNVYSAGLFRSTVDFDPNSGLVNRTANGMDDIFLQKLDANGQLQWVYTAGGNGNDVIYDIAMDAAGYLYVWGNYNGNIDLDPGPAVQAASGLGFFLQKLSPSGELVWAHTFRGNLSGGTVSKIFADKRGFIYAGGNFYGTIDFDPDSLQTANHTSGASTSADAFVLKLDTAGLFQWVNVLRSTNNSGISKVEGVAVDDSSNVLITGRFSTLTDFDPGTGTNIIGNVGGFDNFTQKFDASGNPQWVVTFGRFGNDFTNDIKVDQQGKVYTVGMVSSSTDFDPDTGVVQPSADDDYFIHQLTADGKFDAVYLLQGTTASDYSYGRALALTDDGSIYSTGEFRNNIDIDPSNVTQNRSSNNNSLDILIHKLSICNKSTAVDSIQACRSYTWVNGVTYTANNDTATYIQTNGCDTVVRQLKLSIDQIDTLVSQNRFQLTANQANATYQWLDCNNAFAPISGATAQTYTANTNGSYAVEITNGVCKDTSACIPVIGVGLAEQELIEAVQLLPNPSKEGAQLNIQLKQSIELQLRLYHSSGKLIRKERLRLAAGNHQLSLKHWQLPSGSYYLQLHTAQEQKTLPWLVID